MAPLLVVVLFALAWGGLAFGAVYPWAFEPLMVVCGGVGLTALALRRSRSQAFEPGLVLAIVVVCAAVLVQLIPVSPEIIRTISPETDDVLRQYDLAYAVGSAAGLDVRHPLSIDPPRSRVGLFLLISLATFCVGMARSLTRFELRWLMRGILALGVVMALTGIVQGRPIPRKIYGFWEPEHRSNSFGPFVNRNHFAGWMLMAIPLGVGYFCGLVARAMRGVKNEWRARVLWFASKDANEVILVGIAVLVMGLSLVMTLSRSGVSCFVLAVVLSAWFIARHHARGSRRHVALSYLVLLLLVAMGWAGMDAVAARFAEAPGSDLGGRFGAWRDAVRVSRLFPLTGTGLNTYGTAMTFYQTAEPSLHFAEAHGDYVQLAAEGGVLVGLPAVAAALLFAGAIRHRFQAGADDAITFWVRVGAVSGVLAIALQEIVDFSLQMPGNAALFAVVCAAAIMNPRGG